MQTNTVLPPTTWHPSPDPKRPGWGQVLGWYAAGVLATCTGGFIVGGIAAASNSAVAGLIGHALVLVAIIALVKRSGRLPRRSQIALVLGVVTPFVLAAAAFVLFLWALSHANFTF